MPTLLQTVLNATDQIDLQEIAAQYPWLYERNRDCILSPDSDGLLCGLLMSHLLGWRIRGFYDGKVLVCDRAVQPSNCVFLDMELLRPGVKSVGQHMLQYNFNRVPDVWNTLGDCFAINNVRKFDGLHSFRRKYPFGTIHVLLVLLNHRYPIYIRRGAVVPLLFVDGSYKNLFARTENCYDWLRYLRCGEGGSPLTTIFDTQSKTPRGLMMQMMKFWQQRDDIGKRADRIAITRRGGNGEILNVIPEGNLVRLAPQPKRRGERFLRLLARLTGWGYRPDQWIWSGWDLHRFTKQTQGTMTGTKYDQLMQRHPLSMAMTATKRYEYTLEEPDRVF